MIKDKTILDLVEKLRSKINFDEVEIVDYWHADRCAIGIKKRNQLVYVSTYNFSKGEANGCDYDLELLDEKQIDKLNLVKEVRNVSEEELIKALKAFLDV